MGYPTLGEGILGKIKRANIHIDALSHSISRFMNTEPFRIRTEIDKETNRVNYIIDHADSVPVDIPLIFGDAINNLRCALDHIAYSLIARDEGGTPSNPRGIYFPITRDYKNLINILNKMPASKRTREAIIRARPYRDGNHRLWQLSQLNNIDKHRILVTVGSQVNSFNVSSMVNISSIELPDTFKGNLSDMMNRLFVVPAEKGYPLKPGFVVTKTLPKEGPNPSAKFKFDLVVVEKGITDGESVLSLAKGMSESVMEVYKIISSAPVEN